MNYEKFFSENIADLKSEGRYRVFADLERRAGQFPKAMNYREDGTIQEITVWCSNDYMGMGQNPTTLEAMHDAIEKMRRRRGWYAQYLRHEPLSCPA